MTWAQVGSPPIDQRPRVRRRLTPLVDEEGVEPSTSRVSGERSNQVELPIPGSPTRYRSEFSALKTQRPSQWTMGPVLVSPSGHAPEERPDNESGSSGCPRLPPASLILEARIPDSEKAGRASRFGETGSVPGQTG